MNKKISNQVAILMATYNAGPYIKEQILSFYRQTHPFWKLYVSDDSLDDNSLKLINEAMNQGSDGKLSIKKGPKQGFAANFLSLACDTNIKAKYYAYSDQDDIWDEDKLSFAISKLNEVNPSVPALYCSRTILINEKNQEIGLSPIFRKKASLSNALVQSIAGGNTMVFNHAAKVLLEKAGEVNVVSHDWWTYIVVSACNGQIIYDPSPKVRYRQHNDNIVGTNNGILQKIKRIRGLFNGDFSTWTTRNFSALNGIQLQIPSKNREIIYKMKMVKDMNIFYRMLYAFTSPLYRQHMSGNIALRIAIIFRKV